MSPPRARSAGFGLDCSIRFLVGRRWPTFTSLDSERFYPAVGDNGWAVGPEWWPDGRYARSSVLADIYRIAYPSSAAPRSRPSDHRRLQNDAEFPLCLGYAALAVHALLGQIDPATILRASRSLGIAVGFDSGDFILLGQLTAEGLSPVEPIANAPEVPVGVVTALLQSASEDEIWLGLRESGRLGAGAPGRARAAEDRRGGPAVRLAPSGTRAPGRYFAGRPARKSGGPKRPRGRVRVCTARGSASRNINPGPHPGRFGADPEPRA